MITPFDWFLYVIGTTFGAVLGLGAAVVAALVLFMFVIWVFS